MLAPAPASAADAVASTGVRWRHGHVLLLCPSWRQWPHCRPPRGAVDLGTADAPPWYTCVTATASSSSSSAQLSGLLRRLLGHISCAQLALARPAGRPFVLATGGFPIAPPPLPADPPGTKACKARSRLSISSALTHASTAFFARPRSLPKVRNWLSRCLLSGADVWPVLPSFGTLTNSCRWKSTVAPAGLGPSLK